MSVDLINYLRDIYLPIRYEFAYFSIKNYRNFGVRVTSWTEGAYGVLKRFLKSRNSTLFDLLMAIEEVLACFKERHHAKLQEETTKRVTKYNHSIMGLLWYNVSFAALGFIRAQLEIAQKRLDSAQPLTGCTGAYRRQYGLPCSHELAALLRGKLKIKLDHIDRHWILPREQVSRFPLAFPIQILTILASGPRLPSSDQ